MKKLTAFLTGLLGLFFLLIVGYFFYEIILILVNNIEKININIFIAVIGGTITISSFFITRYLEKKKIIEVEIRNKKIPIYEEFFQFYFKVVINNKSGENMSHEEMVDFFRSFNQKAIIWFPDKMLKSYVDWRKNLINFSNNNDEEKLIATIFEQEELINQFRKDIGHSNKHLVKGDITSLYINDIDKYI